MGRLTAGLVTSHNRSRVHVTAFSYGFNDLSAIRRRVEKGSDRFIDLLRVTNDIEASTIVYNENVDVLVDLTAHTYKGRIAVAAAKPAPIVINYLGFPGTAGGVLF